MNNGQLIIAMLRKIQTSKKGVDLDRDFSMHVQIYIGMTKAERDILINAKTADYYDDDYDN